VTGGADTPVRRPGDPASCPCGTVDGTARTHGSPRRSPIRFAPVAATPPRDGRCGGGHRDGSRPRRAVAPALSPPRRAPPRRSPSRVRPPAAPERSPTDGGRSAVLRPGSTVRTAAAGSAWSRIVVARSTGRGSGSHGPTAAIVVAGSRRPRSRPLGSGWPARVTRVLGPGRPPRAAGARSMHPRDSTGERGAAPAATRRPQSPARASGGSMLQRSCPVEDHNKYGTACPYRDLLATT
jgi:hypothetical protein